MKKPFGAYVLRAVVFGLCGLSACAFVPEREVADAEKGPAVSPALAKRPARVLKRKVAIGRFTNESLYGRSVLLDDVDTQGDVIGKRASDILAARLAETEKFLLFERIDADKIWSEIQAGGLELRRVPVDYLILGSVTEFGRETVGETGFLTRTKKQRAHAKVSVRLVDVKTSRIIYSDEGSGEAISEVGTVAGIGTRAGYDSTLNDKAISAAISKLVSNVVENLLERPWQSAILEREGERIFVAGGKSQGLRAGDRLAVYERGKTVKNPQTGIDVELPGKKLAALEVVELFGTDPLEEVSICRLAEGDLPTDVPLESLVVKEN